MKNEYKWLIGCTAAVVLACLCLITGTLVAGFFFYYQPAGETEFPAAPQTQNQPGLEMPDHNGKPQQPTPIDEGGNSEAEIPSPAAAAAALETLNLLENTTVSSSDAADLAHRLAGIDNIPETINGDLVIYKIGDQKTFWISNVDTNDNFEVDASLRYATDHLYFWIENGISFDNEDLKRLGDTFEQEIYPTNREFFGNEWSPGIDNDPHLYVLYASGLGDSIAGYFSSVDSMHPLAHPYSNGHEMFLVSADNVTLGEDYIYSTMAHEFQHMIHWYRDRNEETWLNEGFSVLAEMLNGYDSGGFEFVYVRQPDLQLTTWPSSSETVPHYGASFLFLAYFLDRFGEDVTKALVANPDNGMVSIDSVLANRNETDPLTGKRIQADDVFADWVITSYLNDASVGDGRFAYQRYSQAPQTSDTEEVKSCSPDLRSRRVQQYGVDYIYIDCTDSTTLIFEGDREVGVLPQDPHSGAYAFWSNKGDESNMTLTRSFDFSAVTGPIDITYNIWYDLETGYDYLYLEASEDGEHWEILQTPSGTDADPSGSSYGWGYNGKTTGWLEETVDLSQFAGKQVQLRFEYVTDAAVSGEGMLLDDVRVAAVNYSEDFEDGDGGWVANGFARIQNLLPQIFRVSLIADGDVTTVQQFALNPGETLHVPLDFAGDLRDAVLVVSGVTRFTTQSADYRFWFSE